MAAACRAKGADVDTTVLDVTDQAQWSNGSWKPISPRADLVANAGISGGTGGVMNGEPISQAREIFDVNLTGVLNTVGSILRRFVARNAGQIALISSMAGCGFPSAPAYSASKGAVRFYGEALRGSLSRSGVKINVICPVCEIAHDRRE